MRNDVRTTAIMSIVSVADIIIEYTTHEYQVNVRLKCCNYAYVVLYVFLNEFVIMLASLWQNIS